MRRKAAEKAKSSPEKVSRRTTRRGRKSPSASPEREEPAAKEHSEEEQEAAPAEPHKSDDSGSEREEEVQKRGRTRRTTRAKPSEEKTVSRPRRSSRRKSQSVEPSDKEDSEREENGEHANDKDAVVMETIPEEKPEEIQPVVSKSPEPEKKDPIIETKTTETEQAPEVVMEPVVEESSTDTDKQNGAEDDAEKSEEQQAAKETKADLCDQSRESGEVDSESVQEEESQLEASKQAEEPTKEASHVKEASEEESSSEKENRKSESPKPVRKSRFRSRTKSPVQRKLSAELKQDNGEDKNEEELEAGEIKDDDTPKRSTEKKPTEDKTLRRPLQRKRRWLSSKSDTKASVITISTDSLKNIISEPVQPVPLSDVKLESSPEPEEIVDSNEEQSCGERRRSKDKLSTKSSEKENVDEQDYKPKPVEKLLGNRKISIVSDDGNTAIARPPSPAKHHSSNILYITNLVRPFTVLQLKSLLARTGKIVENGFWIDKIKSKCFVKYDTEDEAVETRHALHGVRWPASNPKCLHVDFGTESAMEKAIISTLDDAGTTRITIDNAKDAKDFGWSRDSLKQEEEIHVVRPVREWDLGKKDTFDREDRARAEGADRSGRERERERERDRDRDRDRERDRDRTGRVDEGRADRGRRRSSEREFGRDRDRRRGSTSVSPARKFKKKENEPPIRLLDDLFRKTKTTPCIYWLPLTAEQITAKDEQRRKDLAENQRRQEEARKQEEERRKERERRDRERRERPRSNSRDRRRRSRSRDDNRRRHR